jgi:SH3-like domain-containing protein
LRNWAAIVTWLAVMGFAAADAAIPLPRPKPVEPESVMAPVPPPIVATGMPVPRWASIKAGRVNVRRGPSLEEVVLWTYVKPGLPVEIIAEYDSWRRIRDASGEVGWVKAQMLDGRRSVLFKGPANTPIQRLPLPEADAIALAGPGLVAELAGCTGEWCEVSVRGYDGYVPRNELWGVRPGDAGR